MKRKLYTLSILVLVFGLFSCRSAKKLYEKGHYDEAVELAAKKLQKDPDDAGLLNTLREAYRFAVDDHESRIRANAVSSNELKWEWNYYEYASLQRLYDAIYRVPDVYKIILPTDYSTTLTMHRERAGEVHYEKGLALMQRYDKASYRDAYREFQTTLGFIPGHTDAMLKSNEAFEYAVTNVVIVPMQQDGGFVYSNYRVGETNLDDDIINRLKQNSGNEFVRYYSAWEARGKNIRADKEISLQLVNMDIARPRERETSRKVSKEVVVKETVYRPDSIVKQYAKVTATIYRTEKQLYSNAQLRVTVRDENGRHDWTEIYSSTHNWSTSYSRFNGDERALSEEDKKQVNQRRDIPPSERDIIHCMLEEISNNALYGVRTYISRNSL